MMVRVIPDTLGAGHFAPPAHGRVVQSIRAALAIGFAILAYGYLSLPDVRPLRSANPSSTAFMNLRDEEARRKGQQPRHVQRWAAYNHISPELKRAVLSTYGLVRLTTRADEYLGLALGLL